MVDKGTVWLEEREGGEVRSKMRLQKEAGGKSRSGLGGQVRVLKK